jgi:hypothetical protein
MPLLISPSIFLAGNISHLKQRDYVAKIHGIYIRAKRLIQVKDLFLGRASNLGRNGGPPILRESYGEVLEKDLCAVCE